MNTIQVNSIITSSLFRKYWFRRLISNKQTILLIVLLVTLILISLVFNLLPPFLGFLAFLFLLFIPVFLLFKAGKTYRSQDILNKPMTFNFGEGNVSIASDHLNKELTYDQFQKIDLDHEFLLLYLNKSLALFINRENIESSGSAQNLYAFLSGKEGITFNELN